jgi:hypothetical protein
VRQSLAGSRTAPAAILARLAEDPEWSVRYVAGSNPSTPEEARARLGADENAIVRAMCLSTPPAELGRLATSDEGGSRHFALRNPGTPLDVLEAMAADPTGEGSLAARYVLAWSPRARAACLEALASDELVDVREGVASNANAPPALLRRLAKDGHPKVRAAARKALAARKS